MEEFKEFNGNTIPCDCISEIENIKDLKRKLNLSNADLAKCFNMSYGSYANSTAKKRYENAILNFYKIAKKECKLNTLAERGTQKEKNN